MASGKFLEKSLSRLLSDLSVFKNITVKKYYGHYHYYVDTETNQTVFIVKFPTGAAPPHLPPYPHPPPPRHPPESQSNELLDYED